MPPPPSPSAPREHVLIPFLRQQPQLALSRLYSRPSSCLAVFRLLGALARHVVGSLLWLDGEVEVGKGVVGSWVREGRNARRAWDAALDAISKLHIISSTSTNTLSMNPTFRTNLRIAIQGGGDHRSFGVPSASDKPEKEREKERDGGGGQGRRPPVTVDFLDNYTAQKWETILHYLVSSGSGPGSPNDAKPSEGVLYLLRRGGLMMSDANASSNYMTITSKGFQFLLQPPHEQLWDLLKHSLEMSEERGMDVVEVLALLLMLSTMELGQDYSTELLTETQIVLLEDLRDYGLVWQRNSKSKRFYPTRLATTLTSALPALIPSTHAHSATHTHSSSSSGDAVGGGQGQGQAQAGGTAGGGGAGGGGGQGGGFIIVETNYRLYAYTDNPLQIAILNLFTTLRSRFPNLVVGALTRESVGEALARGITAEQIISYLTTHAHGMMRKNNPIISSTIQDQIRIWENERNRVQTAEGHLYADFRSEQDYTDVLTYAKQNDLVLWESKAQKAFFGRGEGHEVLKGYIQRKMGGGY